MKLTDLSEDMAAQALTLRERFSAIGLKLNVQKIIYYYIIII